MRLYRAIITVVPALTVAVVAGLDAQVSSRAKLDSLVRAGEEALANNAYGRATIIFREALDLDTTEARAHHGLALSYYLSGEYEDAVTVLESSIAIHGELPELHSLAAAAYHDGLFRFQDGYNHSKRAFELRPSDTGLVLNLVEASIATDRYDEAIILSESLPATWGNCLDDLSVCLLVHFFEAVGRLLQNEVTLANEEFSDFLIAYETARPGFTVNWSFRGTRYFIANHLGVSDDNKSVSLSMVNLIDGEKSSKRLQQFIVALPQTFRDRHRERLRWILDLTKGMERLVGLRVTGSRVPPEGRVPASAARRLLILLGTTWYKSGMRRGVSTRDSAFQEQ